MPAQTREPPVGGDKERCGALFLGEYQHSLDDKGRLVLPAKFRDQLAGGLVMTKGQDRCVFVFPEDRWELEVEKVNGLARTVPRNRNFARTFFASASERF